MRPYISPTSCTQCGECISLCPYEVFEDIDGTIAVTEPGDCIECGACMETCKTGAIYFDD